ncbi:MAG: tRNA guanosine(34) transglycosylase Tgt [Bacteroidetes bacterium]|nr:tRNA guanosine(34) transglycosylase Tgt [Bacteroidota bacterium]
MKFNLLKTDTKSNARCGIIETGHGNVNTPVFMPVGTQGTVKAVNQKVLKDEINAQIILGNTYHLYLRPGQTIINQAGGIHNFINWQRPILTDSGGFQVYSLSSNRKLKENGVEFRSHIDGRKLIFTPENVIDTQRMIGADIIMAFDECTPYPCDKSYAENSMHLTHRWLNRCIARFNETDNLYGYEQFLFPIVQGSVYHDLRIQSAEYISNSNCNGNAIGGLSVGEPAETMYEITEIVCKILPQNKPRYLMGVGTPENILECISLGIDMFDCVMPTRNARNGMLFTANGTINIKNKKWENDFSPIDEELSPDYSKAYLRHLFVAGEYLASQISSIHNLKFYIWLVNTAREKIIDGSFAEWKNKIVMVLKQRL